MTNDPGGAEEARPLPLRMPPGVVAIAVPRQTGVIRDVDVFGDLATIAAATVAAGMAHFRVQYVEVGNESGAAVKTASADD